MIKLITNKYMVASGAAILIILAVIYYGHNRYNTGFNDRNVLCVQERAEDNAVRQKQTITMQKKWEKIDSRPRANSTIILKRMQDDEL